MYKSATTMEEDSSSLSSDGSSISEDETQKLINSIREIAPSAEIEITDQQSEAYSRLRRSPSPADQPIVDENDPKDITDLEQHEKDKKAVYDHPLFPVLALLLEKCEVATATLSSKSNSSSSDGSFSAEVEALLELQSRDGKPFLSDDPEVDTLMIKAIQVLRIHLLELEKVQDLCKDFCQRYITCLKTKMSSENLLRGTTGLVGLGGVDGSFDGESSCESTDDNSSGLPPITSFPKSSSQTVYQMVQSPGGGLVAQALQVPNGATAAAGHSSGLNALPGRLPNVIPMRCDSGNEGDLSDEESGAIGGREHSSGGGNGSGGDTNHHQAHHHHHHHHRSKQQQKRGILPKQATSIMRSWLFQHIVHPYPTEDEKRAIATQTSLTLLQVNNWFINARRRILQPMLDSANSVSESANCSTSKQSNGSNSSSKVNPTNNGLSKKFKASSAITPRFWPDSIASAIQAGASSAGRSKD